MSLFCCGVDTDILFLKEAYFIKFKKRELKYIPRKNEQDSLIFDCKGDNEQECYSLITEFLSSLSLSMDAIFIPEPRGIIHLNTPNWSRVNNRCGNQRSIVAYREHKEFYPIYPLKDEEQIQLARLYRISNSSMDIYLKVLFFWQALYYPNTSERSAVDYLNNIENNIPDQMEVLSDDIASIQNNQVFFTKEPSQPLGDYIHKCIRHAIAHIKRESNKGKSLTLDNLEEIRHLFVIMEVLKGALKYKLLHEKGIKDNIDSSYYEIFSPE